MNKPAAILFAALLSMGAAARAAEVDFDGLDTNGSLEEMLLDLEDKGHHPPPPQHHPANPPGHHHPAPGHNNNHHNPPHHPPAPPHHNPPHHPPVPPPYHPPSPPPPQYHFGGYERACQTLTFTSQSPLSVTREMTMREYGEECQSFGHGGYSYGSHGYCRPTSRYHSRKVTVNIGPRQLESWETERLEVCMAAPKLVTVDTAGMLYHYSVDTKNEEGFLGFNRRTTITMTPQAKKPSQPDSKELSVAWAGAAAHGGALIMVNDNRSDYFRGERITITAEGMRLAENVQNLPVQDLLDSFQKFTVTNTFDVGRSYELRVLEPLKPGKYMLTLRFHRSGPLSSGATASSMEMIEIR